MFDVGVFDSNIVIDGYISDQPGPYTVKLSETFDIESKEPKKVDLKARKVVLSDNQGYSEELISFDQGIYQTAANGIRGQVGDVYTLNVELLDGRVYQSTPDTLLAGGSVDSIYFVVEDRKSMEGTSTHILDIFFNSSRGSSPSNMFLWKFKGTYQVETTPKFHRNLCVQSLCPNPTPCDCADPLPCSGYALDLDGHLGLEDVGPCTCCTCWVDIKNEAPIVSGSQFSNGRFTSINAGLVPLTQFTLMRKLRVEVSQMSLTRNSYTFWRAIKDQQEATGSLFQPVTGRIPTNFIQLSGNNAPVSGIFFATQINSNAIYIRKIDIPNQSIIPESVPFPVINSKEIGSCLDFPFSTNVKPSFWVD